MRSPPPTYIAPINHSSRFRPVSNFHSAPYPTFLQQKLESFNIPGWICCTFEEEIQYAHAVYDLCHESSRALLLSGLLCYVSPGGR